MYATIYAKAQEDGLLKQPGQEGTEVAGKCSGQLLSPL